MEHLVKQLEKDSETNENIIIDTESNAKTKERKKVITDYDSSIIITITENKKGEEKFSKKDMSSKEVENTKARIEDRAKEEVKRKKEQEDDMLRLEYEKEKRKQDEKDFEEWKKTKEAAKNETNTKR